MMRAMVAILACLLFSGVASAAGKIWNLDPSDPRRYDDSTPLGHAMNVCQKHVHVPMIGRNYMQKPLAQYDDGFEDCDSVRTQWEASQTKSRAAAAAADLDAIKAVTKK